MLHRIITQLYIIFTMYLPGKYMVLINVESTENYTI